MRAERIVFRDRAEGGGIVLSIGWGFVLALADLLAEVAPAFGDAFKVRLAGVFLPEVFRPEVWSFERLFIGRRLLCLVSDDNILGVWLGRAVISNCRLIE